VPLQLGNITFGLNADTSGLDAAGGKVSAFADKVTTSVTRAKGKIDDTTSALMRQEQIATRAFTNIASQIARINATPLSPQVRLDAINQLNAAYNNLANSLTSGKLNRLQLGRTQSGFNEQVSAVNRLVNTEKAAFGASQQLAASFGALSTGAALMLGPLDGYVFRLRLATGMMKEHGIAVGTTVGTIAGLSVTLGILSTQLVQTVINYQKSEMALKGITGSAAVATAELDYLRQVSTQAGLSFTDIAPAFSRFVASATGAGQSLQVTNQEFKQFAMLAGILHLSTEEVNNTMRAFDQMLSMGRVQGQEMRQLFNQLPAVFEIASGAAKNMGVDLRTAMRSGSLDAGQFIQQFMNVAQQMFRIDLAKPIDSLQASLTRIGTAWQSFLLSLNNALQASGSFKAMGDALSGTLNFLAANIRGVLTVVGALVGALGALLIINTIRAGITIAIAAFAALQGLLTTLIPSMITYATTTTAATMTTEQLAAATAGLDVALNANPIVPWITALGMLVAALLGAKLGMDAFNKATSTNMATLADTSGIEAYIAQQKQLGTQVEAVTNSMMKQLATQRALQVQQLQGLVNGKGFLDPSLKDMVDVASLRAHVAGPQAAASEVAKVNQRIEQIRSMTAALKASNEAMRGLQDVSKLPGATNLANAGTTNGKVKDAERGLRTLNDIINKAKDADLWLDNMWRGPQNSGLIDSLEEARRRLFDLKPDQLKEISALLTASGVNVGAMGGLTTALTMVIEKTNLAQDTVKEFARVWQDLDKARIELDGIQRAMTFINMGGDPDKMFLVEAANKAHEALRKLTQGDLEDLRQTLESLSFNNNAIDAIMNVADSDRKAGLQAVVQSLKDMGVQFEETGNASEDAVAGLTKFYTSIGTGSDQLTRGIRALQQLQDEVRSFDNLRAQINVAQRGGNLESLMRLDYLSQAGEALRSLDAGTLAEISRRLAEVGMAGSTATEQLANFFEVQDRGKQALQDYKDLLQQQAHEWVDWSNTVLDTTRDVLLGVTSLREGLSKIFADLGATIINSAFLDPLKSQITGMINNAFRGPPGQLSGNPSDMAIAQTGTAITGLLLPAVKNTAAGTVLQTQMLGTNVVALQGFSAMLLQATSALATMSSVIMSTGGGSGGILGSIFNTAGQAFAGMSPSGPLFKPILGNLTNTVVPNLDMVFPRAAGGPMTAGMPYRVNDSENMELFVPGASGRMFTSKDLGMGGSTHVDARTTLVINGNTDDTTLERVRQMLDAHRDRLNLELPYIIDQRVYESSWRGRGH
jgi:tape measure domain-containing protein